MRGEQYDEGGGKGKGHQGTYIKYSWKKPKEGRIEGGRWRCVGIGGMGGSGGGKMETTVLEQQ